MILLMLALILFGSFTASAALALQGASWGMVVLAYMGGGWAGLIFGLPLLLLLRRMLSPRLHEVALDLRERTQQV